MVFSKQCCLSLCYLVPMMMIALNYCARKGGKGRGEVKGECGRMMMMIAPNSRARKGRKERGR